MHTETPIRLQLPKQDLEHLSVFNATVDAARQWAKNLPVADPRSVARHLQGALDELNRCRMAPALRFSLLEVLQKNQEIATSGLSRRFLNRPLILPEEPREMSELTAGLYNQSIVAYTCVAIQALNQRDSVRGINPARLVCQAIHKALEYCGRRLLLEFQLHQPASINGWLTLNQLYALGERQGLADITLEQSDGSQSSIARAYMVAVLLGCCKPNQLRQEDLALVHRGLKLWSDKLRLIQPGGGTGLFVVDLERDQPPLYSALYRESGGPRQGGPHQGGPHQGGLPLNDTQRQIDTAGLVAHLKNLQNLDKDQGRPGISLDEHSRLPPGLLSHLIEALGSMSVRHFTRKAVEGPISISLGLRCAHYHAAEGMSFTRLLYGSEDDTRVRDRLAANPFLVDRGSAGDAWSRANPEKDFVREQPSAAPGSTHSHQIQLDHHTASAILESEEVAGDEPQYPVYRVSVVNASPGGYCVEWRSELPAETRTGEIVSVQETENGPWMIAVIRWINQLEQRHTLLGLELLSPRVMAYGAITRQKTGQQSAPQRVLLLPAIQLVGQPHTLITPRTGFRERQKITLMRKGEKLNVQLQHQVATSGSYAQFDFRYIRPLGDVVAEDNGDPLDAVYDSVWYNI